MKQQLKYSEKSSSGEGDVEGYDPKKGAGEFRARPETKLRTIVSVEILWWAGTSPTCGTMAPPNEGEDCEQCPISTQSGSRSHAL